MNKFVCVLLCTLLTVGCKDDKTNSDNQGPGPDPGPDPTPPAEEVIAEVDPLSWTSVDGLDRTIEPGVNYETPETRGEKRWAFSISCGWMPLVRHRIADLHGRRSEAVRNRCGKSLRHPEAAQCESDRSGTGARKHFSITGENPTMGVLRIRRRMGHPQTRPDAQRCRRRRGAVRRNQRIHLPRRSQKGRRRLYGDAQRRLSNAPIRVRCALRRI